MGEQKIKNRKVDTRSINSLSIFSFVLSLLLLPMPASFVSALNRPLRRFTRRGHAFSQPTHTNTFVHQHHTPTRKHADTLARPTPLALHSPSHSETTLPALPGVRATQRDSTTTRMRTPTGSACSARTAVATGAPDLIRCFTRVRMSKAERTAPNPPPLRGCHWHTRGGQQWPIRVPPRPSRKSQFRSAPTAHRPTLARVVVELLPPSSRRRPQRVVVVPAALGISSASASASVARSSVMAEMRAPP